MVALGADQAQQPHEIVWALRRFAENTIEPTLPPYASLGGRGIWGFAGWLSG
jgi:hypothetical protein